MAVTSNTFLKAFSFTMDTNLEELGEYLSKKMGKPWISGSKFMIGEYIAVNDQDTGSIIRIFKEGDGFAFDMLNKSGRPREECFQELEAFKNILVEKNAQNFAPTEDFY
jgi:hypothetical protein